MKRLITILMAALMLVSAVGCAGDGGKVEVNIEGSLEEIMDEINAGVDVELPELGSVALTSDDIGYYVGVADLDFKEALASEAMINVIAHSVCLVRMNAGADVEEAKKQIEANADPRKWICVEAEKVIVDSIGDLVILIMSDEETAAAIHESFLALKDK